MKTYVQYPPRKLQSDDVHAVRSRSRTTRGSSGFASSWRRKASTSRCRRVISIRQRPRARTRGRRLVALTDVALQRSTTTACWPIASGFAVRAVDLTHSRHRCVTANYATIRSPRRPARAALAGLPATRLVQVEPRRWPIRSLSVARLVATFRSPLAAPGARRLPSRRCRGTRAAVCL